MSIFHLSQFGPFAPNETLEEEFRVLGAIPNLGSELGSFGEGFGDFGDFARPSWDVGKGHLDFAETLLERLSDHDVSDPDVSDADAGYAGTDGKVGRFGDLLEELVYDPGQEACRLIIVGPLESEWFFEFRSKVAVNFGVLLYAHVLAFQLGAALKREQKGKPPKPNCDIRRELDDFVYCGSGFITPHARGILCDFSVDFE